MKNIRKAILISCIILIFLGIICFVVSFIPKKKQISDVYYESGFKNFEKIEVLKANEEPFTVYKDKISGISNVPVDDGLIKFLFNFVEKIKSDYIFSPKEDLNNYGLKNPCCVFNVSGPEEKFSLKVGNKTADKSGYYLIKEDSAKEKDLKIAVISSQMVEKILIGKLGYIKLRFVPYYEKTFGQDGQYNKDGVQKCVIKFNEINKTLNFETDEKGKFILKNDEKKLDKEKIKIVEKAPSYLIAKEVFCVNPSEKELKRCGLTSPKILAEYLIDDKKYCFKIGKIAKMDQLMKPKKDVNDSKIDVLKYYYFYVEGIDAIYIVNENVLPWLDIDLEN